jgi:hypothetical protein
MPRYHFDIFERGQCTKMDLFTSTFPVLLVGPKGPFKDMEHLKGCALSLTVTHKAIVEFTGL